MRPDDTILPFDVLMTTNRSLAGSHMFLGDAICAMRCGWTDTARELLTLSNNCLREGGYDPLTVEPSNGRQDNANDI